MGQSSSRVRGADASSPRPRREPVPQGNQDPSSSPSTSSTKAKRRSNVRKSIINLVKPSKKEDTNDTVNTNANRKSWRRSRRWSRAPSMGFGRSDVEDVLAEQSQATASTSTTILPAASITAPKDMESPASTLAIPVSSLAGSGSELDSRFIVDAEEAAAEGSSTPTSMPQQVATSAEEGTLEHAVMKDEAQSSGQGQSNPPLHSNPEPTTSSPSTSETPSSDPVSLPTPIHDHSHAEASGSGSCTAAEQRSDASTSTPQNDATETVEASDTPANQTPNNRFPPPGTLVVVQGVVHTTDVPRPSSSALSSSPLPPSSRAESTSSYLHAEAQTQTEQSSHSIRRSASTASRSRSNRLSALFGSGSRPSSMNAGIPSSSSSNAEVQAEVQASPSISMSSTMPADTHVHSDATVTVPNQHSSDIGATTSPDSSDVSGSASVSSHETSPTSAESSPARDENEHERERPSASSPSTGMISSSSIDILGTLLSVAAAATAASLLTGSSEPILSSGLTPPSVPRVPTGGIGLDAGIGGLAGMGGLGGNVNASGRADRMRQAWGSIRERLGLRASGSGGIPSSPAAASEQAEQSSSGDENVPLLSEIDGDTGGSGSGSERPSMEARDRMLAEMSRAFQLGLGLNNPGPGGDTGPLGRVEASLGDSAHGAVGDGRFGEMPPEGSFERFLVDLQADLRVTLGGGVSPQQQQARREIEPEDEDEHRDGSDSDSINELFRLIAEAEAEVRQRQRMIAQRQSTLRALTSGFGLPSPSTLRPSAASQSENARASTPVVPPRPNRRARVESTVDSDEDMPGLADVSDSESIVSMSSSSSEESTEDRGAERDHQRTEASLARLASMVDSQPAAVNHSITTGAPTGINSISDMLNRRRAMGIGRTPPAPSPVAVPEASTSSAATPASTLRLVPDSPRSPHRTETPARRPPTPIPTSATEPLLRAFESDRVFDGDGDVPRASPTIPTSATFPQTHAGAEDGTGRINWWRLYRFPPIAAPPPRAPPGQTRATHVPTPSASLNTSSPLATETTQPTMSSTIDTSSPVPPPQSTTPTASENSNTPNEPPTPSTVVPVIVVGLQSVNLGLFGPPPPLGGATQNNEQTTAEPEDEQDGERASTDESNRGPRRWRTRAADAFRNLRPGRRASQPPNGLPDLLDGPGSRTFLIYVIGGYYPPDHSIVTGDPESFNSWETLLDLAELLGQIKPPTASREEIERSGLEVIKSTSLSQYEQEGKISSNCTERCLICLDDYVPEDDVRVLTCKHAFHMECVDKWLQEGKNNCPACRGAGVSTSSS